MKAVFIREPGGPEVLTLREVERPEPGAGEVRVLVASAGVNRADLLQRLGRYPAPPGYPPDVPGLEIAGTVDAVGADVGWPAAGDRVMGITGGGGYSEAVVVSAGALVPVPEGIDTVEAGAIPEAFMTAYDAAVLQGGLAEGEVLLVHAVGSGVGTAALQLGVRAGATVIGTSRTPEKLEHAEALGLQHPLAATDDWPEQVLEITDGRGADVVLDLVGGAYLAGNQRVLARGGRQVVVGIPSGGRAEIDLSQLMARRGSIRGRRLRDRTPEERAELASAFTLDILPGFELGELRPVVDRVFPAAEAGAAHAYMQKNRNFGKILLAW